MWLMALSTVTIAFSPRTSLCHHYIGRNPKIVTIFLFSKLIIISNNFVVQIICWKMFINKQITDQNKQREEFNLSTLCEA